MSAHLNLIPEHPVLRAGALEDANDCGQICYEAFKAISTQHNFPPDFPEPALAIGLLSGLLTHEAFYAVVAEDAGRVVGSNFLDERNTIAGVGPITVDPQYQNRSIGHQLMQSVLKRAAEKKFEGVRLLQAAYHNRSLSLYTKLGFVAREPISVIQGTPPRLNLPGYQVRPANLEDIETCNRICVQVHGHDRSAELFDAIKQGTARVVEYRGVIVGYTTLVAFFGHSVATSNDALKTLIANAEEYPGPGFHVPTRNFELFRWCLEQGLRVVQPMTLMTTGRYQDPSGPYLPSIYY